jgi:plastocyanin
LLAAAMALLGVGTVLVPALALSEGPAIQAVDSGVYHYWSPMQVSVTPGGAVTFSNPSETKHGVEWRTGPATPSCSAGVPVGNTIQAAASKWSGTCTFTQPGTYTFYCTVHGPEMHGAVTVSAGGETTVTTTTPTTTATAPSTTPGTPAPGGGEPSGQAPAAQRLAGAISLPSGQHGRVRGSLSIWSAAAAGRLEVDLLARPAVLASAARSREVVVGRLLRSHLRAGRTSFAVSLRARARGALRRRGRISLTVRIVITPVAGHAAVISRKVLMRP